jgi:PAS domain S-box-containing protein
MTQLSEVRGNKVQPALYGKEAELMSQEQLELRSMNYQAVFRNLFSRAPLGVYQADPLGRCLDEGRPLAETGGSDQISDADAWIGFVHADDRDSVSGSWERAIEAGVEWSREFRYRAADGKVHWLHATLRQLRNSEGAITGYLGCNTDVTARVETEQGVSASEEWHRMALEAANAGVWDLDVQTYECHCSPYCLQMIGHEVDRSHSRLEEWVGIIHPEDIEGVKRVKRDCIDGSEQRFRLEFRLRTRDGKWNWFLCEGKPARRDNWGRTLRMVGTLVDISERKRVEELLRMEHDLLDLITTTSPVGIMFVQRDGKIAFVNPRVEQILGLTKEEILRRGYDYPGWQITTHSGRPLPDAELPLREVLEGGQTLTNTCFAVKRPDGQRALLSMNAAPFLNAEGEVGGTVVILEDVTEQKQHEQVLADNDKLLRETQRIAQLGSYVLDLANDRWSCSSKLSEILGIDETFPLNLLGHFEIVHPDFRKQFIDSYLASVMNSSHFEMEYKVKRYSDGVERWVAECCELDHDESGKLSRMIGTIQDITERKAAEEAIRNLNDELDRRVIERTSQLAAANKEIESFSYSVSHDLRAPLRHINSYSAILVEEQETTLSPEARYYLDRICTASSRMGKLIDDLLTLTRVGRTEMKYDTFDISALAAEVAEMLREAEPEREVKFVIQQGLEADGDSVLIRLVLENLLGNSMKYAANNRGATIEFGETTLDSRPVFFVKDDGVGFDMAYAGNLFQPFQRLHGAEFEGTGIGLATVKRIIERHGGSIRAEGKENEGATFYFSLPAPTRRSALKNPQA